MGFKQIRGSLRKKAFFPAISGFPKWSSDLPEKGKKGRKRAKKAGKDYTPICGSPTWPFVGTPKSIPHNFRQISHPELPEKSRGKFTEFPKRVQRQKTSETRCFRNSFGSDSWPGKAPLRHPFPASTLPSPPKVYVSHLFAFFPCDPSDHLQESPGPPRSKSPKSLRKSRFGDLQKVPEMPEKV